MHSPYLAVNPISPTLRDPIYELQSHIGIVRRMPVSRRFGRQPFYVTEQCQIFSGRFFQILWPSQNIQTLKLKFKKIIVCTERVVQAQPINYFSAFPFQIASRVLQWNLQSNFLSSCFCIYLQYQYSKIVCSRLLPSTFFC